MEEIEVSREVYDFIEETTEKWNECVDSSNEHINHDLAVKLLLYEMLP